MAMESEGFGMESMAQVQSDNFDSLDVFSLRPNLLFDPHECVLVRRTKHIPLTARECTLLLALVRVPRRYISTRALGRQLSRPYGVSIDEHSIQQTICDLRRKMGESARHPRVLLTKRGIGYGIFPRPLIFLHEETSG